MNLQEQLNLSDDKYGLLFDVRRSVRYHERRMAFYERCHSATSFVTILLAGSVIFDLGKDGKTAVWLVVVSMIASLLSISDMVFGYSKKANLHDGLRSKFSELEIKMLSGVTDEHVWAEYQRERLLIEKDEPAIYKVLDALCRNELLYSEGFKLNDHKEYFVRVGFIRKLTRNLFRHENVV